MKLFEMLETFLQCRQFLDQMFRTSAFHHLSHKELTVAYTGLHNYNILLKTAVNSPLSGYKIFGSDLKRKLIEKRRKDVGFVARLKV